MSLPAVDVAVNDFPKKPELTARGYFILCNVRVSTTEQRVSLVQGKRQGDAIGACLLEGLADCIRPKRESANAFTKTQLIAWKHATIASIIQHDRQRTRRWEHSCWTVVFGWIDSKTSLAEHGMRQNGADYSWTIAEISQAELKEKCAFVVFPMFGTVGNTFNKNIGSIQSCVGDYPRFLLNARLFASKFDLDSSEEGQDQRKESLSQTGKRLNTAGIVRKESRQNLYHVGLLFAIAFGSVPVGIFLNYRAMTCWASRRYVISTALFALALIVMAGALTGLWTVLLINAVSGQPVTGIAT